MSIKKKPSIRFKGFTNDWEQCEVKELFKLTRGYVLAATLTSEKSTDETPYPVYSSQTKDNGLMGFYKDYLYENAITWTTDGANAGTVNFRAGKFYCTNVCGVLLTNEVEPNQMISEAINNVAKRYVSYVGNPKLMNNVMAEIEISLPVSVAEQNKISKLFENFNNLITLHQLKYEKLKNIKKYMLEKMFPKPGSNIPEIRFNGFTCVWEKCNLSNMCSMHARIGWQNLRISEFLDNGDYYLITGTDFDNGRVNFETCHYVEKSRYVQDTKIQVQNGSILITKDGTLGKVAFIEELDKPATLNAGVFNIEITKDFIDNKYLFQYLKTPFLMDYVEKKATGGTIKHLNQNILIDFPVALPGIEEQKKIGRYFEQFDYLITLHQHKYEKLKNIKKAMLEKMFV